MAHLTLIQRQEIALGIRSGESNAKIARRLGVHPSTVGREIKRNSENREQYAASMAQTMAASRQILAARHRFAHFNIIISSKTSALRTAPYADWHLIAKRYWRPLITGFNGFYNTSLLFFFIF